MRKKELAKKIVKRVNEKERNKEFVRIKKKRKEAKIKEKVTIFYFFYTRKNPI